MMKIAIAGATGRMGKMLIETVLKTPDAQLVGALEHAASEYLGQDAGAFLGQTLLMGRGFIFKSTPMGFILNLLGEI